MNEQKEAIFMRKGSLIVLIFLIVGTAVLAYQLAPTTAVTPVAAASKRAAVNGSTTPFCRFGVNVNDNLFGSYDATALGIGWYVNYDADSVPDEPNNIDYVPIIRLDQENGSKNYSYTPSGSDLQDAIAGNPGADWLIGNEPDRKDVQDDIEPDVYAAAYHELYNLIKTADPSARIFAGTIVQPTALRLQYLDLVLESYRATHGTLMPVDGWSIHNFILNEVSCDYDPGNCWGAEIPPGIDADFGEIIDIDDNDNLQMFTTRIENFRQWMDDRGYGGLPVYLSEYGILMPQDFGFDVTRVNAFMNNTFDYMLATTDMALGDPYDDYRLIQKFSWYSTTDTSFNGWLFNTSNLQQSAMGSNYAAYTAALGEEIDLAPVKLSTDPLVPYSTGGNVNLTLQATVANSGNLATLSGTAVVRFYLGDPNSGGTQIGTDQTVSIAGCGFNDTVSVPWNNVAPGAYEIYITVDETNAISETDETNNSFAGVVLVATEQIFLPISQKNG